jgi:hypothetical protein
MNIFFLIISIVLLTGCTLSNHLVTTCDSANNSAEGNESHRYIPGAIHGKKCSHRGSY